MDILIGVLFCYGVLYASRKAWENVKAEFSKSRAARRKATGGHARRRLPTRHDVAWWAREARYGFPVTRAGFHKGWLAHQLAMDQHFAQREEARTSHLEARASVVSELKTHRQRQETAHQRIMQASAGPAADDKQDDDLARKRAEKTTSPPQHPPPPAAAASPPEGTMTVPDAEMNYTQTLDLATQIEVEADEEVHNIRYQRIANLLDALTSLGLDSGTQGDFGEVDESLRAQQKAAQATADAAAAARAGLVRRHGGIKEAVDSAPAPMAEKPFYEE